MRRRQAFTLVELLVVIGIIAVLVGILLPTLGAARRQAASVKCAAELREIGNCFKMYELENKGYWPVSRISGYKTNYPTGANTPYNIDGVNYPTANGAAYWFTFLAKYATKGKVGTAVGTNSGEALQSRKTIFFGCPEWDGYRAGGVFVGDTNVVQVGYGMNPYPAFEANVTTADIPSPEARNAEIDTVSGPLGRFLKAKAWTRPAERMLVADSKFWRASAYRPPALGPWPPAVVAQPIYSNVLGNPATDQQFASQTTAIDIYRHGKTPKQVANYRFDPRGGKISYNVLYADGHVSTAVDGREAYRSIRMKFPG